VFRSGDRAIWGHNIVDCDGEQLVGDACTPDRIHIYPIYWPNTVDGSGPGGARLELRMHPDDVHIGWSSVTNDGGQYCYFGRMEFSGVPTTGETRVPRFDMVDVNLLVDPARRAFITSNGTELQLHPDSITVGELRGFSGSGTRSSTLVLLRNPQTSTYTRCISRPESSAALLVILTTLTLLPSLRMTSGSSPKIHALSNVKCGCPVCVESHLSAKQMNYQRLGSLAAAA
jgi:hypothetical protein